MIALIFAGAMLGQNMTQAEMIAEGEELGRSLFALGMCGSMGYQTHEDVGIQWAENFGERATASGWAASVGVTAIERGQNLEDAETRLDVPGDELSDSEFVEEVTAIVDALKVRCRRLAAEHPDLLSNIDQGDRNADAQRAIMLGPLAQ